MFIYAPPVMAWPTLNKIGLPYVDLMICLCELSIDTTFRPICFEQSKMSIQGTKDVFILD